MKKFSDSWGRGALSWGKNEASDRGRGMLGGGMKAE